MIEYLAGNRIIGTSAEKPAFCTNYNTNTSSSTYADIGSESWAGVIYGTILESGNAHIGKKLCAVKFKLYRTNTNAQTLSFGIVSTGTTNGTLDYSFTETVDATTLTTNTAGEDVIISGETLDHVLAVGDIIAVRSNNSSTNTKIRIKSTSDAMTNAQVARLNNAGTWYVTGIGYMEGSFGVETITVQDGAVFYEKDTNKEYVLNSGVWTKL